MTVFKTDLVTLIKYSSISGKRARDAFTSHAITLLRSRVFPVASLILNNIEAGERDLPSVGLGARQVHADFLGCRGVIWGHNSRKVSLRMVPYASFFFFSYS